LNSNQGSGAISLLNDHNISSNHPSWNHARIYQCNFSRTNTAAVESALSSEAESALSSGAESESNNSGQCSTVESSIVKPALPTPDSGGKINDDLNSGRSQTLAVLKKLASVCLRENGRVTNANQLLKHHWLCKLQNVDDSLPGLDLRLPSLFNDLSSVYTEARTGSSAAESTIEFPVAMEIDKVEFTAPIVEWRAETGIISAERVLEVSNMVSGFEAVLDWIFFSETKLQLCQSLRGISRHFLRAPRVKIGDVEMDNGLPSAHYPSDHISIAAEFCWRD